MYISGTAEGTKIWLEQTASNKKFQRWSKKRLKNTSNQVIPSVLSGPLFLQINQVMIALLCTDKYTSAGTLQSFLYIRGSKI